MLPFLQFSLCFLFAFSPGFLPASVSFCCFLPFPVVSGCPLPENQARPPRPAPPAHPPGHSPINRSPRLGFGFSEAARPYRPSCCLLLAPTHFTSRNNENFSPRTSSGGWARLWVMDLLQAKAFYFCVSACGWKGLEAQGEKPGRAPLAVTARDVRGSARRRRRRRGRLAVLKSLGTVGAEQRGRARGVVVWCLQSIRARSG